MKKTNKNLILLAMLFGVSLVISNVVTGKLINTGITLFGAPVTLPSAVVCYWFTFLITDIVGEIWGPKHANLLVRWGMIGQVVATLLIIFAQYLPASDPATQEAYIILLGQNWVFVIASLTGYICSQTWDVFIFHRIRAKYVEKHGSRAGGRWIWNNVSTMTSQIIDTVLFIGIAFGLGFGWLFQAEMRPVLFTMMLSQYVFKAILALIDTPIFYIMTRDMQEVQNDDAG